MSRVVLVGFMGAGKTSVGGELARRLGWSFADMDHVVEAHSGRSIESWFAEEGEAAFREAERQAADLLMTETAVVIASGGGWAAQPGRLRDLPDGTVTVWLDVGAGEALRRVLNDTVRRPLVDAPGGRERVAELLEERRAAYALADVRVDTNGRSVDDVTSRICQILESRE